jgi:prepilin-type N-terminal cleavage/methylation domain-containing protein
MFRRSEAGFTLIELILVTAISGMLLTIAFAGQRGLRARAEFDATINKVVASAAAARNEAIAGVNTEGLGDGETKCAGTPGPPGDYVFAGTAWTADDSLPGSPVKVDYYKAIRGGSGGGGGINDACIFYTREVFLPTRPTVDLLGGPGGRVLYVRSADGGVVVCPVASVTIDVTADFAAGGCQASTTQITFALSDGEGHSSSVLVDKSGLPRRQD